MTSSGRWRNWQKSSMISLNGKKPTATMTSCGGMKSAGCCSCFFWNFHHHVSHPRIWSFSRNILGTTKVSTLRWHRWWKLRAAKSWMKISFYFWRVWCMVARIPTVKVSKRCVMRSLHIAQYRWNNIICSRDLSRNTIESNQVEKKVGLRKLIRHICMRKKSR